MKQYLYSFVLSLLEKIFYLFGKAQFKALIYGLGWNHSIVFQANQDVLQEETWTKRQAKYQAKHSSGQRVTHIRTSDPKRIVGHGGKETIDRALWKYVGEGSTTSWGRTASVLLLWTLSSSSPPRTWQGLFFIDSEMEMVKGGIGKALLRNEMAETSSTMDCPNLDDCIGNRGCRWAAPGLSEQLDSSRTFFMNTALYAFYYFTPTK